MGSEPTSESFCQMTGLSRLAAVPGRKFQVQDLNDCFNRKRTMANNRAMTEFRTLQTFALISLTGASGRFC